MKKTTFTALEQMRRKRCLTQAELAEIAGLSRMEIVGIEGGSRIPNAKTLEKLANALDCPMTEIIGAAK